MSNNRLKYDIGQAKMITEEVGKRIKQLRAQLNISQEELGFRSGVHRTYIAGLEVGKRNVSIITLKKIVDALGVSMGEFFSAEVDNGK